MSAVDPFSQTPVHASSAVPREVYTTAATPVIPTAGTIFDEKYRIESVIGQGGMAIVLSAMHLHLDERVAIKLMLPQWAEDPELVERFMQEGRAATKIRSEHVVRVLDVGLVLGRPYLVMEYLEGKDLDQLLGSEGKLPVSTAIDYLLQACEAIAEAHVCRIIHRDLKPANLFLTHRADGSPCMKVLDFGISKRMARGTRPGTRETLPSMIMGSPHYMSPEQVQSSPSVDERSDIWALGAILHELVAGTPPFQGPTITALCAKILTDSPPSLSTLRPDVPLAVAAVALRCLEKNPDRRFANVSELATALAPLGSDIALASALRIRRVLDGQTGPVAHPVRRVATSAARILESAQAPKRGGVRAMGYVIGAIALVAVGSQVGFMVVSRERALEANDRVNDPPAATDTATLTSASTSLANRVGHAPAVDVAASSPALAVSPIASPVVATVPPLTTENHVHHTHHGRRASTPFDPSVDVATPASVVDDPALAAPNGGAAPAAATPPSDEDNPYDQK